jgi:hypothetical protein
MRSLVVCGFVALGLSAAACPSDDKPGGVEELTPEQGVTFHILPFEVPPGEEVQDCYFVAFPDLNGDGSDVWVNRFKIGQRTGSHHMNVFRVRTILNLPARAGSIVRGGECRISTNWADWPLVVNSQESGPDSASVDWNLPPGVAQRFTPGELLMIQTHYVNADLQTTPADAEVRVNFYRSPDAAPIEMGTLFATQQSIRICQSNPAPVYDGACAFPEGSEVHLAAMNGHFHSRGDTFKIFSWDGRSDETPPDSHQLYQSDDWNEPPMAIGLNAVVPEGGGVWWSCGYQWQEPSTGCDQVNAADPLQADDCCYVFGNNASFAEHCNVFVYYWPKVADTDIFCN